MRPGPVTGVMTGLGLVLVGSALAQVFLILQPPAGLAWLLVLAAGVYWVHARPLGRPTRTAAAVAFRPLGSAAWLAWVAVPTALLLGMGVCGVVYAWTGPIPFPIPLPEGNPIEAYIGTLGGWLTFTFYAALVGPMIEEFAFRGWIQQSLRRRFGALAAISASAILFAALHLWYSHPQVLLVPLVLGVIWGAAVHLTRSIWAGVLLHGAWNTTLMLIQRSGIDSASFFLWSHPDLGLPVAITMIVAATGTLGLLWWRHSAQT